MSDGDLFERVLASLHKAALDDAHWLTGASLINEAIGTRGHTLALGRGNSAHEGELFFLRYCFGGQRREDWERAYVRNYSHRDERWASMIRKPKGVPVHTDELYAEGERKASALYNELLRDLRAQDALHIRLGGSAGLHIGWIVADPIEVSGWSSDQLRLVKRLGQHMQQFVYVRQALVDARALGASLHGLLDNTQTGVIQLDRRGRIVAANDSARVMLRQRDALFDTGGFLRAATPAENAELQRLLASALPLFGGQGVGGSMAVRRSDRSRTLFVHVNPVEPELRDLHTLSVAALVLAVTPANPVWIDPEPVALALGLTPAESRVAAMLAGGHTVRDIAEATGRKQRTIDWHLHQIFRKQDITRQAELVRRVLSLRPLAGSRRRERDPPTAADGSPSRG